MVVRVEMVVMEKNKRDGGEDGRFIVVVMELVEGDGVVAEIVAEVVAGGVVEKRDPAFSQG